MKRLTALLASGLTAVTIGFMHMASAADIYVTTNGAGDGSSWASPTNNLQGAINTIDGTYTTNTVWVSNGVYAVGGVANYPAGSALTNRIAIWKAITVRSANNDPTNTIIKGAWNPSSTNGPAAVRCVYMVANSRLIGFTLTNGAALTNGDEISQGGGGMACASTGAIISNCVLTGNSSKYGGGTYYGTLYNCTISGNSSKSHGDAGYWAGAGGGCFNSILYICTISGNYAQNKGGAAAYGAMYKCQIIGNSSLVNGGGLAVANAYDSTIVSNTANSSTGGGGALWGYFTNCTFIGNSAPLGLGGGVQAAYGVYNCLFIGNSAAAGGGAYLSPLYNCTVVSNSAAGGGGGVCAAYGGVQPAWNTIVFFNTAGAGSNWYIDATSTCNFTNSCTAPVTTNWASGNTTADPKFVNGNAGNYRLSTGSPCINAGTNYSWMTDGSAGSKDLDGRKRIQYGTVDMGVYEFLHTGAILGFR